MTRIVYLAHPVAAPCRCDFPELHDREVSLVVACNCDRARRWLAWALREHPQMAFCVPWLPYMDALPEDGGENRARGLRDVSAMAARCDEVWLVGGRVSRGMAQERDAAHAAGRLVVDMTGLGDEPPGADR